MAQPRPYEAVIRRRELVIAGTAGGLTLLFSDSAEAGKRSRHHKRKTAKARLPPRLTPTRRRTLAGLMDLEIGGLTAAARTRAVNRVEATYRHASAPVRARTEATLDRIDAAAEGFWTKSLDERRAFVALYDPPPGQIADFTLVQGFRRFVQLEGAALAAAAVADGLVAGTDDPSISDAPDVVPPHDATGRYPAREATESAITADAVREGRALARTAFDDDPEED